MKQKVLLATLLICSICMHSQQSVSFTTLNSHSKELISNACIIITSLKDSTMIAYGRTNLQGELHLALKTNDTSVGIWVLHPHYLEYTSTISLKNPNVIESIALFPKNKVLKEVIITSQKAITMNGDTITYVADSFKVRADANVEDLLKKLPGITVDKNGTIKAQGKEVTKVFVDGDDFFGSDPTLATKNLDAKMVDKVEVIEVQSAESKQTGVDNGEKDKVINLKLKEEHKKGIFGKVEAGYSNTNRYIGKSMFNLFNTNTKFSGYLSVDNINSKINYQDKSTYGDGGNDWIYDENLDTWINSSNSLNSPNTFGVIPRTTDGGVFFSHKLDDDGGKIAANYKMIQKHFNGNQWQYKELIIDSLNSQYTNSTNSVLEDQLNQSITGSFQKKLDSNQKIGIQLNGVMKNSTFGTLLTSLTENKNHDTLNYSEILSNGTKSNPNFELEADYTYTFKKPGRQFGLTGKINASFTEDKNINKSTIRFNENNTLSSSAYNQQFINKENNVTLKGSAMFIEPLYKKKWFLELNFSILRNTFLSQKNTYDFSNALQDYSTRIDSLSNNLDYAVTGISQSAKIRFSAKKTSFVAGITFNEIALNQRNTDSVNGLVRHFFLAQPYFNFNWKFEKNANFTFSYIQSYNAPKTYQLQAYNNNSNPFYITKGNPNLSPSTNHSFSVRCHFYKPISKTNLWSNLSLRMIQNDIVSSKEIAENGKTIETYTQTNGNWNLNGHVNYGFSIFKIGLEIDPYVSFGVNKNATFINKIENINFNSYINTGIYFPIELDTTWSGGIDLGVEYRKTQVNNGKTTSFNNLNSNINAELKYNFMKGWSIGFDGGWNYIPANELFDQTQSYLLLKASLSKKISWTNPLTISLIFNDILNQNRSINRSLNNNSISQTTSDALSRYVMLKLDWKFKGKNSSKSHEND